MRHAHHLDVVIVVRLPPNQVHIHEHVIIAASSAVSIHTTLSVPIIGLDSLSNHRSHVVHLPILRNVVDHAMTIARVRIQECEMALITLVVRLLVDV